jgi:hypothetical protein
MNQLLHNALQRAAMSLTPPPLVDFPVSKTMIDIVSEKLYQIYEYTILTPLAKIYLFGPSFLGWGFWAGQDLSHICSQKTNVPADFWEKNPVQCVQLITRSFYGMVVVIETFLYCWLFWTFFKYIGMLCRYPCKKESIDNSFGKKVTERKPYFPEQLVTKKTKKEN